MLTYAYGQQIVIMPYYLSVAWKISPICEIPQSIAEVHRFLVISTMWEYSDGGTDC